ncbi:hypothetical protein H5410_034835 [Solanum commersonii]|uniref:Uncharacterized protein n=1 Tax=Solanum commersonii TaxID=4109 RepID=A0A9J5YSH4_SOLCO|nr:hypothetical protein H5410_034835 [Solanum commersonii]
MVEFAQDIMQQKSDSLLYVATFAEYLSDQIETSLAKGANVSENDDPPKPKSVVTQPPEEDLVHVV